MLKKLLLILGFLLPATPLAAQFSKIYYPHINRAELAITREQYTEALAAYREAFAAVKYPLALDLCNAVMCKISLRDFEGAKPFLLKLATKGIPAGTLEEDDLFRKVSAQWETFKPVYSQIQSTFETALPDSVQTWALQCRESYTETPMKVTIRLSDTDGNTTGFEEKMMKSLTIIPFENVEARMKLEQHLGATGGYGEEADGPPSGNYLLSPLNTLLFSESLEQVLFRQKDTLLLAKLKKKYDYVPQMDGMTYLLQGIETGKWHRNLYNKLLRQRRSVTVAYVKTEEDCGNEFSGYYISGQPSSPAHPFQEDAALISAKTIFHFSHEAHGFKLGTEQVAVNRKDFPSCRTAREEMQHWIRMAR